MLTGDEHQHDAGNGNVQCRTAHELVDRVMSVYGDLRSSLVLDGW